MPRLTLLTFVLTALVAAFGPGRAQAQTMAYAALTGTVVDDSTGVPLEGAHVFIATSLNGTVTDAQGRYRLDDVPLGAHRLYVTTLGYEPEARDLMLREGGVQVFEFRLQPSVLALPEVSVESKEDKNWRRRFEKFKGLFLGETPNAAEVEIMNPFVLDFSEKAGLFQATASEPLVIENRALGYRVTYFLRDFQAWGGMTKYDGEPLYEELGASGPEEEAIWEARRRQAFMGSLRHFWLALLAGQVEEQGFTIYAAPALPVSQPGSPMAGATGNALDGKQRFPITADDVYSASENANEVLLDFHGAVEILYRGEREDAAYLKWARRRGQPKAQTSWVQLQDRTAVLDYKGDVLDPYGVIQFGYYAWERVADDLPKEYRPR